MANYCEHCGSVLDAKFESRTFGDLSIVQGSRELWCNERRFEISPVLEGILFDLMSGKPLTREAAVMRHTRSEDTDEKTLDTQICKIRELLRDIRTIVEIRTLWALGWQMNITGNANYEQRAFGDVIIDLDRRLVIKGKKFEPVYPQVFDALLILLSGDLEPHHKLRLGSAEPRWLIDRARRALKAVGSNVEIRSFPGRGFQMIGR